MKGENLALAIPQARLPERRSERYPGDERRQHRSEWTFADAFLAEFDGFSCPFANLASGRFGEFLCPGGSFARFFGESFSNIGCFAAHSAMISRRTSVLAAKQLVSDKIIRVPFNTAAPSS